MQILPAIDIKDGQAVRLFKGDFNQKTVVNPDVLDQAKTFAQAGIAELLFSRFVPFLLHRQRLVEHEAARSREAAHVALLFAGCL